jgi:UDP-N-acetylglucosamine--N-acetylmuramyl-(pentapeptide) pyrophosphoryl-undecaprenol N-acetylglucosamine transferase
MATRWVIAGGGTGGHVTPALALGEAIKNRGDSVLFIGSAHGLESKLVPDAGFELETLPSQQVMGRSLIGRLRGALSILCSVVPASRAIRRFEADAVISVGGYAAMPAALAARLTGRPLFLVEPNAHPGRVNRMTARFARSVFVGFESARGLLPRRTETICLGVPLRRALLRAFDGQGEGARTPTTPLRILVFGGSQGARQLNEGVPEALMRLSPNTIDVFHQTGEADREAVTRRYADAGIAAEVVAFERNMATRYRWADLAICRAGALTVAELALAGMPALLAPYPFAADDHQAANARALEEAGAARRLETRPLDVPALAQTIAEFVQTPARLLPMREAARSLARPDAAAEIIETCHARLTGRSISTHSAAPTITSSTDSAPDSNPTEDESPCSAS